VCIYTYSEREEEEEEEEERELRCDDARKQRELTEFCV
jgi:hypothetical protein